MKNKLPTSIAVLVAALAVVGTSIAISQQPAAVIELVSWSPQEVHDAGLDQPVSGGLHVVGLQERVYLRGSDGGGADVTSFMWSVVRRPEGSAATIDDPTAEETTFTPDVAGRYEIELTITTAEGQATTTQLITGAEYVGVGGIVPGRDPDVLKGQCAICHRENTETWNETGHADFFERAIDGLASDHYNGDCISCHVVGYRPDAVNGGFDDVAEMVGWEFPDSLVEGNWQDMLDNYPDLAELANIQCENCHGPGSMHRGDKRGIAISIEAGLCATCHDEEPYHVKNQQWKASLHATGTTFARGTSAACAPCHSGWGFIAFTDPESNLEKTSGNQNITCAVCHDPHESEFEYQLRNTADIELIDGSVISFGDTGKQCMNCHKSREEANDYVERRPIPFRGPHHSVQTEVLAGLNVFTFGLTLPNSTHKDVAEKACVTCHMSQSPADGEPGHQMLGEHSWAMNVEVDGEVVDNVSACINCHNPSMESFDDMMARVDSDGDGEIETTQQEVHGLLENVAMLLPPRGEPTVDTGDTTITDLERKGLWNFLVIEEDGSFGIHNHQFAVSLLQVTERALAFGVLAAGDIRSVRDVPNDQGKQVEVQWTRFGGDGITDEPVQVYHVWRRGDAATAKERPQFGSLRMVPAVELESSASVAHNGEVWTAVTSQPAASLDMYSAIAPTLYDSTADGAKYSVFMVSGHTANTQVFVTSAPDSGYSIDNLAPHAPVNLVARTGSYGVVVEWDEPSEPDFDYFTVYRSTEPGFAIENGQPMRNVESPAYSDKTVEIGQTYYYKVVARDLNGNVSVPSIEVSSGLVTDVEATGGIPTEFALHPNYPNPFNPSTNIIYDVPVQGQVSILMYDVVGRVIDVLVEGSVAAGSHTVTVDAGNLPSGLYIIRMTTQDSVHERTITLLR